VDAPSDSGWGEAPVCRTALAVERIEVLQDRVACDVVVNDFRYAYTTPSIADRVRALRPDISSHTCVNSRGDTFNAVIARTPLPHLLEHLVIDILTETSSDPRSVFVGTSEWTDKRLGRARVEVSMTDDLAALRAFKEAVRLINEEVIQ